MTDGRLLTAGHSAAFLPEEAALRRMPRAPQRRRPPEFLERYEDRALVYDAFWHVDGKRILLVGPPPMNLMPSIQAARYEAMPGRMALTPRYFPSLSTMITELSGAPAGTTEIVMHVDGFDFPLPVRPNHAADFAGRRLLFTMSKDNDLDWIEEWARWHARMHGTDAIVLFDNGSSRYGVAEIEARLLGVGGIEKVLVESWPYRYGMTDQVFVVNPYYILFLQVSSMSVMLRRYGANAYGILNADIDELVMTPPGSSIFELVRQSSHGLVVMCGRYIEPLADQGSPSEGLTHRHFTRYRDDPKRALSRPSKWAIDPSRRWFENLLVHPYMHWIDRRPWFSKSTPPGVFYRHFRAISTNWKDNRTENGHLEDEHLVTDADFAALVASNAF